VTADRRPLTAKIVGLACFCGGLPSAVCGLVANRPF